MIVAKLPRHIAQSEVETAASMLTWGPGTHVIETTNDSAGPGNAVMIEIGSKHLAEIFTAFGQLGVIAENVAKVAAREAREHHHRCHRPVSAGSL